MEVMPIPPAIARIVSAFRNFVEGAEPYGPSIMTAVFAFLDFRRRVCRYRVTPCSGRRMKEMLGLEGRLEVGFGGAVVRGISWSSMIGSVELCVECNGKAGGGFSGVSEEEEFALALVCGCGVEPSFQLAMEKG